MGSKFIFKVKYDSQGHVSRWKLRLVVQGFTQREGIDYDEVFAPVAHHETIRVMLSVAAAKDMLVHQVDFTTAFLVPEVQEELYLELPVGWPSELPGDRETQVCKLNKTLYGLKQSPRVWNSHLNDWMVSQGFTRTLSDTCLYTRCVGKAGLMYVTVWVDDLLIACTSLDEINKFRRWAMHSHGRLHRRSKSACFQPEESITMLKGNDQARRHVNGWSQLVQDCTMASIGKAADRQQVDRCSRHV